LKTDRFAAAGRHQNENIPAGQGFFDNIELMVTKCVVAEKSLKDVLRRHAFPKARVQPMTNKGRSDRSYKATCSKLRTYFFVNPAARHENIGKFTEAFVN
jgi:hypothetical protein